MASLVLATFGSLGSLHPYLELALALRRRGHDVSLASSESYRARIEAFGIRFCPVRPDRSTVTKDAEISRRSTETKSGSEFAVKNLLRHVGDTFEDLLAACRGADLFVSHPAAFCGPLVAEKLGIRWLSVALAPATLFSASDPPVLPSAPWLAKVPRVAGFPHSLIFRFFKRATRGWMRPLDDLRAQVGLPPTRKHPFFEGMFSPFGTLGLFSRLLAKPQADWPPLTRVTGFPFFREPDMKPDPDLERFLEQGEPPIVFTLGSNVVRQAGPFYQHSFEAAIQLGRRAVLLAGDDPMNQPRGERPGSVFVARYAPYSHVFLRAAAVVHPGGIGTVGEAMAAGVPMLVVPHVHDQPDNAFRARRLGVARTETRERYNATTAAAHLTQLLSDGRYKARAIAVQREMETEDGASAACSVIEQALAAESKRVHG